MALEINKGKRPVEAISTKGNVANAESEISRAVGKPQSAPVSANSESTQALGNPQSVPVSTELGSSRADLAFVCPLGDPSNPDTTRVKLPDGSEDKKVTSTIVGYKFRVEKDMQVPECGTNEGYKGDPMNYKEIAWRDAKAGEVVALTPFETALLLSQEKFNGGCTGGEKPVSCVYQSKTMKTKSGQVATASAAVAVPRVSLRAATGSIKDFDIEDVLTFIKQESNGVVRKIRSIKPGFEKWAPLASSAVRKTTTGGTQVDPTTIANKHAQAFLALVKSRK